MCLTNICPTVVSAQAQKCSPEALIRTRSRKAIKMILERLRRLILLPLVEAVQMILTLLLTLKAVPKDSCKPISRSMTVAAVDSF